MTKANSHPVNYSVTTITELMIPSYANFGGKIHGGIILSLMDKVAYACASKHSGMYCVTVSVDDVDFHHPVEVGELVHLRARVVYVGNTSLIIHIKVDSENVKTGLRKHTNTSFVTMVAKDEENKPATVPPLILENEDEVMDFVEALRRKDLNISFRKQLNEIKKETTFDQAFELLQGQRCEFQLKRPT